MFHKETNKKKLVQFSLLIEFRKKKHETANENRRLFRGVEKGSTKSSKKKIQQNLTLIKILNENHFEFE